MKVLFLLVGHNIAESCFMYICASWFVNVSIFLFFLIFRFIIVASCFMPIICQRQQFKLHSFVKQPLYLLCDRSFMWQFFHRETLEQNLNRIPEHKIYIFSSDLNSFLIILLMIWMFIE